MDLDLGSGGAMLLPDVADSTGAVHHLLVGAGKDFNIYVGDRDNLGKFNAKDNSNVYQELPNALPNGEWGGPAYFNNTVYFGGVGDVLKAYTISNAKLSTTPTSQSATSFAYPGTTPSVSANGTQNGIVWALESATNAPAVLHAYDAANLAHELYNSKQAANGRDAFGQGNKFITPMVSNGMVFVGTPNAVAVFGLLGQGSGASQYGEPTAPQVLSVASGPQVRFTPARETCLVQAQEAADGDVFVQLFPVDAVAVADELPRASLLGGGVAESGEELEGSCDFAAVSQTYTQHVVVGFYADGVAVELNPWCPRSIHSISPTKADDAVLQVVANA